MKEYEIAILKEKGDIVNKALKLVNKLAENEMADIDDGNENDYSLELRDLIIQARTLKCKQWFEDLIK